MARTVILALGFVASGCGQYANRGETLYREGRYIEAAEAFEFTEVRLRESPTDVCACYGLYRGLNYLELGDLRSARHWLAYAYAVERRTPGTLDDSEKKLLDQGWQELERRAGTDNPAAAPEARVAATQPHGAAPHGAAPRGAGPTPNGRRTVATE